MELENKNVSKVVIKNSIYSSLLSFIIKLGGFFITIALARLLLPELFGIYTIVLSIVIIFMTFTNLGTNETLLRYLSEAFGKNNKKKARNYFRYLFKIKSFLILIVVLTVLLSSKFLAYNIYNKPLLFFPLIFSCFYIVVESFKSFFGPFFFATKEIKPLIPLGILHQILKVLLSFLALFFLQEKYVISGLFVAFAIAGLIYLFLILFIIYKKDKEFFVGVKENIDKRNVRKYLTFIGVTTLSLAFFASVDTLMLGKFVESSYIGYYRVSLGLILTISAFFSLSGVFLPIFTQIDMKRFERGFKKTFRFLMILAIPSVIGIIFIAKFLINLLYGHEYSLATPVLYVLSLLILTSPLIDLYTIIFQSREKPGVVAKYIFVSLGINILLNYVLIKYLLNFGQEQVIVGVGISTVISRVILLGFLMVNAKKKFNLSIKRIGLRKPIFATLIMGIFLLLFNYYVDINLFWGIVEVLFAIIVYVGILRWIKGLTNEDLKLIKSLIKK
ncbi:oligosaccharide flippase family protein [Candidatus Pacearchaeota archaeon]|nr:oligosaccharide flippase family protein [Candidatus Pacearchaeota archaeon]